MRTVHAYFRDGKSISDEIELDPPIKAGELFVVIAHRGPDQVPQGRFRADVTVNLLTLINPQAAWGLKGRR